LKTDFTYDVSDGTECGARFSPDLKFINVSGFIWEEICTVYSKELKGWEYSIKRDEIFRGHCQHFKTLMKELSRLYGYETETDFDELLLHTLLLTCHRVREGLNFTKPWLAMFKE